MIEYLGANSSTSGAGRSNDHGYPVTEPDGAAAGLFFRNTLFQFLLGTDEFTASVNHAFRAAPGSRIQRIRRCERRNVIEISIIFIVSEDEDGLDRTSTRLNSSNYCTSRMPSSA